MYVWKRIFATNCDLLCLFLAIIHWFFNQRGAIKWYFSCYEDRCLWQADKIMIFWLSRVLDVWDSFYRQPVHSIYEYAKLSEVHSIFSREHCDMDFFLYFEFPAWSADDWPSLFFHSSRDEKSLALQRDPKHFSCMERSPLGYRYFSLGMALGGEKCNSNCWSDIFMACV